MKPQHFTFEGPKNASCKEITRAGVTIAFRVCTLNYSTVSTRTISSLVHLLVQKSGESEKNQVLKSSAPTKKGLMGSGTLKLIGFKGLPNCPLWV